MDPISIYEKREELRRVLQSKQFVKAPKKSRFLEFVCEQSFAGNADKLNEYLIGVEIYERGSDFDPQDDPIVRVQAHQIRRSLRDYYEEEGRTSPWRIDLPAGHYVPMFVRAGTPLSTEMEEAPVAASLSPPSTPARPNFLLVGLALLSAVLGALLIRERFLRPAPLPTQAATLALPEGVEWFWKPFLPPAAPPLIVIPNHPLLRAAHDGDSPATRGRSKLIPKDSLPEFRDTIHFRELKGFYFVPTTTDFTAIGETLGLMSFVELFHGNGQKFRLKASRLVDFEEVKRGNAILLGGNQAWSGRIFLYSEGFRFQGGVIYNRNPRPGEKAVYKPEFDPVTNHLNRDYALVLMLPNERKDERVLLIYGIYTQSSQAAIEYVTNPERLKELRRALLDLSADKKAPPPFFQLLLATTVENYVPGQASLVSARAIPDPRPN